LELKQIFRRLLIAVVYALPATICFLLRVRFLVLSHADRIGHLSIEPDCYVKEGRLGLRKKILGIFLVPPKTAANKVLLRLWAEELPFITSGFWCRMLVPLARIRWASHPISDYAVAINQTALCPSIQAKWKGRAPLLSLSPDLLLQGRKSLVQLGLPADAWYVCVHSREAGYSPSDEHLHSYRNSDIDHYVLAMRSIVERGGWCIRVGEPTSKPILPMKGVIDYAHSPVRSESMDVFLCASCKFFLGNSSGLHLLSSVFGVSSALANLVPISTSLPFFPGDIGIPKLLRRVDTGEALKFSEILGSPVGNYRFSEQYVKDGIAVEENSPEDIRELALEMLERRIGTPTYTPEDEFLQQRFRSLFREGHYSFGADSRIGRDFLRKYANIID